jgi:hypothetical protein
MYNARRLGVRIPFIGWQANITSEKLEYTRATIANMSTGGAYLITETEHEPGSIVTLWIKSSQLSFFVTAQVLRNDLYGIAVRFLDLCESDRISILEIITRFLSRGKPERLAVVKKPAVCAESPLKFSCNP